MLCVGPLVPFDEKVSEAGWRVPLPFGVKVTVNAQLPPAATDVHVCPVSANSAGFPETLAPVMVSGPLPVFVTVKALEDEAAKAAGDSAAASARAVTSERKFSMSVKIQIVISSYSYRPSITSAHAH
jgi:hypothetical protein